MSKDCQMGLLHNWQNMFNSLLVRYLHINRKIQLCMAYKYNLKQDPFLSNQHYKHRNYLDYQFHKCHNLRLHNRYTFQYPQLRQQNLHHKFYNLMQNYLHTLHNLFMCIINNQMDQTHSFLNNQGYRHRNYLDRCFHM